MAALIIASLRLVGRLGCLQRKGRTIGRPRPPRRTADACDFMRRRQAAQERVRPAPARSYPMMQGHEKDMAKPVLTLLLASPRGFCAGVDRAIQIVERALERFGAPVYVRHEIVHNRDVVEALERKGAVFVEELAE